MDSTSPSHGTETGGHLLQNTALYTYQPLGPDQIRVLDLLPTKHRIECRVRQIALSSGGYQALSYVWGSRDQPFQAIVVDEHTSSISIGTIPLTQNLRDAIYNLRDAKYLATKRFWIDQICINQEDDQEKSSQVALMGEIYNHADRIITYVGTAGDEEEENSGIKLLERLNQLFPTTHEVFERFHKARSVDVARKSVESDLEVFREPAEEFAVYCAARYANQGWKWLLETGLGEWTERLWIVQVRMHSISSFLVLKPFSLLSSHTSGY